jgi:hypothetical protein
VVTQRLALFPVSSYSLRVEGHIYLPLPTLMLYLYLPLFSGMRVWTRMAQVSLLGVAALAALGFHCLASRLAIRRWVTSVITVCLVVLEFSAWPYAMGSTKVEARPVDLWLAAQSADGAVMEFPLSKALSGRALYATLSHGKSIASGYGTFFPAAFNEKRGILETFPAAECLDLLRQWGVKYLLVGEHTYGSDWPAVERELQGAAGVRVRQTFDDKQVYSGDRLLKLSPLMEQAEVVDRIHVYELE